MWGKTKDEHKAMKVRCAMPVNMNVDSEWQGWGEMTSNVQTRKGDDSRCLKGYV